MPTGDYAGLRYSTLDAITPSNVKNLRVITTFSTGIPNGHEGQPLVIGGTMYVVTPFPNNLIAVDLSKPGGAIRWVYQPHPDRRAVGILLDTFHMAIEEKNLRARRARRAVALAVLVVGALAIVILSAFVSYQLLK